MPEMHYNVRARKNERKILSITFLYNLFLPWEHYTYISNDNCVCIDVETYLSESLFL